MLLSRSELWRKISEVVEKQGLLLFDLDMPSHDSGVLRVYISKEKKSASPERIGIEDCAAVNRLLNDEAYFQELLESYAIEVSSPGVNRRLQRPEHYAGAVGEHVKVTAREQGRMVTYVGMLRSFDGSAVELELDGSTDSVRVAAGDIQKARVDFLFE